MVRSGLPYPVREKIWKLKTIHHKTYKEIKSEFEEEGLSVTENQIREAIREIKAGKTRGGLAKKEITDIRVRTREMRGWVVEEIKKVLALAKEKEDLNAVLQSLKLILTTASDVDRFEGRGVAPKTQINILKVEAKNKKLDWIMDWILKNVSRDKQDVFERELSSMERVVDAEYQMVNEE